MKKRMRQLLCMLISTALIVTSMPMGVLAEELVPTPGLEQNNIETPSEEGVLRTEVSAPAESETLAPEEPVLVNQETTETMNTAATLETMAIDGDYTYTVDANGNATLTAFNTASSVTKVSLPTSLGGKTLVKIGAGAFKNCTAIEEVIIPYTVTTIESASDNRTFGGCTALTNVTIPSNVSSIGPYAFSTATTATITGETNSKAANYASEYNITFVPLSFSIESFAASLPSGQNIKTAITLATTVTGGTGSLSYQFYYDLVDLDGNKTTTTLQDWSSAATTVFTPTKAGTYTLYTNVKDSTGYIASKVISQYAVVNTPVITTFTENKKSPQYIGESILLTAELEANTGTAPFTYEFSTQVGSTRKVIQAASGANTCTYIPDAAGTYTLYVTVKDGQGLTVTKTITNYLIVDKLNLDSFSVDKTSPQELGTTLKLTAQANGGKTDTTEYRFYYTLGSDPTELDIQDYSSLKTATFTPPAAGEYHFYVDITNASGIIEKCPVAKVINYSITDTPMIEGFTAQKADGSPFYVGDTDAVELTATGISEGTSPYTYEFFYKIGSETQRHSIEKNENESATSYSYSYFPLKAGNYSFYVDVTDSKGLVVTKQVSNYNVYDKLTGTITVDKASPQNKETTLKLTATAAGGKTPYQYEFFYKLDTDSDFIPVGTQSTSKTVSLLLNEPGDYELKAVITDANGREITAVPADPFTIRDNSVITEFYTNRDNELGHYAGDAITLTAVTDPVKADSTYQFACKQGSKTIWTSAATTAPTATYTPTVGGTYTFTVTVKDADGATDTEVISNYKVLTALSAKAVKLSKTSGIILGDTIKITAAGSGGKSSYQYRFYYKKDGGAFMPVSTSPTTLKTIEFVCSATGTYTFYVDIIDANGIVSGNRLDTASPTVQVTNPPIIKSFSAVKDQSIGETITGVVYVNDTVDLIARVEDNKGEGVLTYDFYYTQGSNRTAIGSSQTINPRVANEQAVAEFVPPVAGSYSLFVTVTDTAGSTDTEKIGSYKVLPGGTAKVVQLSKTSGLQVGESIKLTASATGGKSPYQYLFYVKEPAGSFVPIGVKTKDKTINYTFPTTTGEYTFAADIIDANGVVLADKADTASVAVTITNPPEIAELKVLKTAGEMGTSIVYDGDTVQLTAVKMDTTGDGSTNYKFEAKQGTKTIWTSTESTADNASFSIPSAGTYTLVVTATDSKGSKTSYSIKSFKVLPKLEVKSIKASKTTDLIVGDEIRLTATGAGGQSTYRYQFRVKKNSEATYTLLGTNDKAKTYTFIPTEPGVYTFSVVMTDANGVVSGNEITTKATVGDPPVIKSFLASPGKGSPVYVGDTVNLTAKVVEGTGLTADLTYDFYYLQGSNRVDIDSVTNNTYTSTTAYVPERAGTYTLCVDVTDGNDSVTAKIGSYTVLPAVEVKSLTVDKESGVNIATAVKLTAVAAGGKSPYTYEFYVKNPDSSEKIIRSYSTSKTADYKPTAAGFYSLHVRIKDANGELCVNDDEIFIQDFEVVDYPIIKSFTPSLPSGQYVDTEITLTAVVTGGVTPYNYTFTAKKEGGTEETLTADVATPNQVIFEPDEVGIYTFVVTVTDLENNPIPGARMEIKSYKVIALPTVKSFTVSKDIAVVKSKVTLKAVVEGGQSPYQYKFTYKKDGGTETTIRDYSTTASYIYAPQTTGDYVFTVYIKDKNGEVVTKDVNLKVTN